VHIGFVRNQSVEARGTICIAREAVDGKLYAHKKIQILSKGLGLAGGSAFAIEGMDVGCCGTERETPTLIQLGSDPRIRKILATLDAEMDKIKKASLALDNQLREIQQAKKKSKDLFEGLIQRMEKVMETKSDLDIKLRELQKKKAEVEKNDTVCPNPVLRVSGDIFPGVVMQFHDIRRTIEARLYKRLFFIEKGYIVESPLV
jgi:uncharacterized protein (DUF342 family)